jgi:hypothetical protein
MRLMALQTERLRLRRRSLDRSGPDLLEPVVDRRKARPEGDTAGDQLARQHVEFVANLDQNGVVFGIGHQPRLGTTGSLPDIGYPRRLLGNDVGASDRRRRADTDRYAAVLFLGRSGCGLDMLGEGGQRQEDEQRGNQDPGNEGVLRLHAAGNRAL